MSLFLLYILDQHTSLLANLLPTRLNYVFCPLFFSAKALRSGDPFTALPAFTTLVA